MRYPSIRARVTAAAVLGTAVATLALGWLFLSFVSGELVDAQQETLAQVAGAVDGIELVSIGTGEAQYVVSGTDIEVFLEFADDGELVGELWLLEGDRDDPVRTFVLARETGAVVEVSEAVALEDPDLDLDLLTEQAVALAQEVVATERSIPAATEASLRSISDGIAATRRAALVVGPLLVATVGALTWLLVRSALAPTNRMAREVAAIDDESLHRRVTRNLADDEVDRIAEAFNAMLDRIEQGMERERRFVADASHELRTPLATARMAAELAAADAPDSHYVPQVIDEIDRMDALVDDLLQLARQAPPPIEDVDLSVVVRDVVGRHPDAARISATVDRNIAVRGQEPDLRRVVINLVDNALRYGDQEVAVSLVGDDGSAVLTVDDDGPGIPVPDRERVLERFVRLDEGRSRDEGGSGLGLAIVAAIVDRHQGTISVDDSPLGGARFRVSLSSDRAAVAPGRYDGSSDRS
jgi:signal transduction histidine kinase